MSQNSKIAKHKTQMSLNIEINNLLKMEKNHNTKNPKFIIKYDWGGQRSPIWWFNLFSHIELA